MDRELVNTGRQLMRLDGVAAQEDDAGPPPSHSLLRLPHCSLHGALTPRCPQAVPQHAPIDIHRHVQGGELRAIPTSTGAILMNRRMAG